MSGNVRSTVTVLDRDISYKLSMKYMQLRKRAEQCMSCCSVFFISV
jgi:hypothetical protein